ncbi:hypothetical protein JTE90_014674 [Oedothorax gibbosus]|uniref:Receptor ligand binding region domain-containing protein n=1 Tax=Oedothorax gibbosus TaxID=931172 RepID=A0AAV6UIW5_9ARAC|nr:hypothetical protein JTE90_014674 [Oedothorax gibbosus]
MHNQITQTLNLSMSTSSPSKTSRLFHSMSHQHFRRWSVIMATFVLTFIHKISQFMNKHHQLFTIALTVLNLPQPTSSETFTIGYLTNMHGRHNTQKQGLVISGAISYALDVVNNNASFLNGHKLRMVFNDTEGDTRIGTYITIQQWHEGAIAFFGPEDSCAVEATVAASLNLPMISYVSTIFVLII